MKNTPGSQPAGLRRRAFFGKAAATVAGALAGGVLGRGLFARQGGASGSVVRPDASGVTPRLHPDAVPRTKKKTESHG